MEREMEVERLAGAQQTHPSPRHHTLLGRDNPLLSASASQIPRTVYPVYARVRILMCNAGGWVAAAVTALEEIKEGAPEAAQLCATPAKSQSKTAFHLFGVVTCLIAGSPVHFCAMAFLGRTPIWTYFSQPHAPPPVLCGTCRQTHRRFGGKMTGHGPRLFRALVICSSIRGERVKSGLTNSHGLADSPKAPRSLGGFVESSKAPRPRFVFPLSSLFSFCLDH